MSRRSELIVFSLPGDAEELVGSEYFWHQDAVSLVVPRNPPHPFVAGGLPVNLAHEVVAIRSELDAEFRAGGACRDVGSVRSGLEAVFGEPVGERDGEGSEFWSVAGGECVGGGGDFVG